MNKESVFEILYECGYKSNDGHKMYHVKCKCCGWETNKQLRHIKLTTICKHRTIGGFYISDLCKENTIENPRIKKIYYCMIQRCYNVNDDDYERYGKRNVKICDEWLNNPKSFEEWSLNNGYNESLTIDRINIDKNYSPINCRWITNEENARWKSTTHSINVDGEIHTGREWSNILNLGTNTINLLFRKYEHDQVIEFIRRRRLNPNEYRKSHQTWMSVYGLE